jgi:hypothetical protein
MDNVNYRVRWARHQEQEKQKVEDEKEKERGLLKFLNNSSEFSIQVDRSCWRMRSYFFVYYWRVQDLFYCGCR